MGTQRDMVVDELRELLVTGDYRTGQTLSENELAKRFGTSRTPIREAVAILSHEGLIEQIPQVGIRVRPADPNEVNELVNVRGAVEKAAADALCERHSVEDLRALEELVRQMAEAEKSRDRVAFLDYDTEFHSKIAELAGFRQAANMLRSIRDRIRILGLDAIETNSNMHDVLAEHRNIIGALETWDSSQVHVAIETHLARTGERLFVAAEAQENEP
jgi:DNA-binding GntR family transcriptional regulator